MWEHSAKVNMPADLGDGEGGTGHARDAGTQSQAREIRRLSGHQVKGMRWDTGTESGVEGGKRRHPDLRERKMEGEGSMDRFAWGWESAKGRGWF